MKSFKSYLIEEAVNTWWQDFGFITPPGKILSGNKYNSTKTPDDPKYSTQHGQLSKNLGLGSLSNVLLNGYITFGFEYSEHNNTVINIILSLNLEKEKNKTLDNLENFLMTNSSIVKNIKIILAVMWKSSSEEKISTRISMAEYIIELSKIYQVIKFIDHLKTLSKEEFKKEAQINYDENKVKSI